MPPERKESNDIVSPGRWWWSFRFSVAILGFLGFMNMNAQRVAMSFAIVCMVNHTAIGTGGVSQDASTANQTGGGGGDVCPGTFDFEQNKTTIVTRDGELVWEKRVQGLVLGAIFWGYMVSQIPGGWLAGRIGGRRVYGYGMFVMSLASLLMPVGARFDFRLLIVLRFLAGMGAVSDALMTSCGWLDFQGVSYPAMHAVWGRWAPPLERSKLAAISYAGGQIGNVITMPTSALLCEHGFDGGWPSIFYVFGALGIVWFVFWMLLLADSPDQSKRISQSERDYIVKSLAERDLNPEEKLAVPWKSIITSLPVWAIVVGNMTGDWSFYMFETSIPTYMKEVLRFDIAQNGLFSALPYLGYFFVVLLAGFGADFLINSGLSIGSARKVMECIGKIGMAVCVIALGFMDCTKWALAMALLTVGVAIFGAQFSGYLVNHVDLAPRYAGLLMGISNSIACVMGVAVPYVVAELTPQGTRAQWQVVFYTAAGVSTFGAIFFTIFAKGDLQPWASGPPKSVEVGDEEKEKLQNNHDTRV